MTEDPLSEVNGPSVSDHRGTEGVHLATVKGEADRANVAVQASVLMAHWLIGSPRPPASRDAGVS